MERENMKYQDITSQYTTRKKYQLKKQKYFIDNNGNEYRVDGRYIIMRATEREVEVARVLGKAIGGKVNIIPRINKPLGIKTPDYIVNEEKFDLKEIIGNGKYVIEGNLKGKKEQSNNFVIDITKSKIKLQEVERQIRSIYISRRYLWINKILIVKQNNIIRAYERKKVKVNCEPKLSGVLN